MSTAADMIAEHRRKSYELWEQMARPWERRRSLTWRFTRSVSEWLVDRVDPRPGQTLLDLAAGTGETGFLAAARLGHGGRLISSDFAPEMVEAARRVAAEFGVSNADFRVLDAERIELGDASVDGVICRYGYMLMAEPLQALRETRRVLRRDGRLAFSAWADPQYNPWMTFSAGLMIERGFMPPFSADGPGMFSMSTPQKIQPLVNQAGFEDVLIEEMEVSWRFDDADELWIFASELQGPVALAIGTLGEEERRAVRSAIEERAAGFSKDGGYELPGLSLHVVAS